MESTRGCSWIPLFEISGARHVFKFDGSRPTLTCSRESPKFYPRLFMAIGIRSSKHHWWQGHKRPGPLYETESHALFVLLKRPAGPQSETVCCRVNFSVVTKQKTLFLQPLELPKKCKTPCRMACPFFKCDFVDKRSFLHRKTPF